MIKFLQFETQYQNCPSIQIEALVNHSRDLDSYSRAFTLDVIQNLQLHLDNIRIIRIHTRENSSKEDSIHMKNTGLPFSLRN